MSSTLESETEPLTITPKLRLSEEDKNGLLSWTLKFRFPGICLMIRSTHMILEPTTQAAGE